MALHLPGAPSAHVDTFTREHLPPAAHLPELIFEGEALQLPPQLNAVTEVLDRWVEAGRARGLA